MCYKSFRVQSNFSFSCNSIKKFLAKNAISHLKINELFCKLSYLTGFALWPVVHAIDIKMVGEVDFFNFFLQKKLIHCISPLIFHIILKTMEEI